MDKKVEKILNKVVADSKPVLSKLVLDELNKLMPPYMPIGYEPIYTEFVEDAES